MPIPAAIEEVLARHGIEFAVSQRHPNSELSAFDGGALCRILQDSQGRVQVVYRAGTLLDLDKLCRLTDRNLAPPSNEEIAGLCDKLELLSVASVPKAFGLPVIIDEQLLQATEIHFDSGNPEDVVALSTEQFRSLIDGATVGAFTVDEQDLLHAPLDASEDVEQITHAVASFTQLRMKQRLEETLEFPPLPETAQRIIKLRVDPNADIKDLTDIVETDPSLAAQVVSWAASPYYAAPGKIKSVHDAIVRVLGFDLVLNLSLGLALGKTLNLPKDHPKGFSPYWHQAVYAAAATEALVGAIAPKERPAMGLAYLGGLLHNFGYLILAEVFPPHFSNLCRYQEANPYSNHCLIERHLLGVTREQLGAWLLKLWNMPEEVCVAIRFQGEAGFQGEHDTYARLLHVALRLLRKHGIGDAPLAPISDELYASLHLDRDKAEAAVERVLEGAAELNAMAANLAA